MIKPIYAPKGRALEYGELALNIYTGCPHRCSYCYAPLALKRNRESIEEMLEKIDQVDDQILAFKSDMMFQAEKNSIKVILTSGVIAFISVVLLIVVRFGNY